MRKLIFLFLLVFSSFVSFGQGDSSARAILNASARRLSGIRSLSYKADYSFKSFDSNDTLVVRDVKTTISRELADTVLGYYGRVDEAGEITRLYDGSAFYLIDGIHKTILRDNPSWTGKSFTRNNMHREITPPFLYQPVPYSFYLDPENKISLEDTAGNVYTILVRFPKNEEITEWLIYLYIDKKTMLPNGYISKAVFANIQHEYKRLDLREINIIDKTPSFHLYDETMSYAITDFKSPAVNYDLLPVGTDLPVFSVTDLHGKTLEAAQLKDKIVLLAFWYTACPPCIREFSILNTLYSEFKNQGLLIAGMNSFDTSAEKLETVRKFARHFQLKYPLYRSSKEIDSRFSVKIFPTVYLAKNGKIVYRHYSFSEENNNALRQAIVSALKK